MRLPLASRQNLRRPPVFSHFFEKYPQRLSLFRADFVADKFEIPFDIIRADAPSLGVFGEDVVWDFDICSQKLARQPLIRAAPLHAGKSPENKRQARPLAPRPPKVEKRLLALPQIRL